MVKDYTKECWYCHGGDIVPDSRGVRCCTCGATWNPVPRTGDTSEAGQALSAPTMVPREDKLSQRGHKAARTRKGNPDQAEVPENPNGAPVCRFATPYVRRNRRLFRIDITIVCPQSQESKCYLPLCRAEIKHVLQELADELITRVKKPDTKDPAG